MTFGTDIKQMRRGFLINPIPMPAKSKVVGKGELALHARITYVNGISTTLEKCLSTAEMISSMHGNTNVHFYYVETHGFLSDSARSIVNLLGVESEEAQALSNLWKHLIADMGGMEHPHNKIIHYAHSRGGIITKQALTYLTPQEKNRLDIRTFGSPVQIDKSECPHVVNIASTADKIPLLSPLQLFKNYSNGNTRIIKSPEGKVFWEHGILDATYGTQLARMGQLFVTNHLS